MDKTLEELIVEVQSGLYQAAGVSTQVYSQETIVSMIKDAFLFLATDPEKRWKRFDTYVTRTLDGTTGRTTVPLSDTFVDFDFISAVFVGDTERKLTAPDWTANPARLSGTSPLHLIHDTVDVAKVVPATATGTITAVGKTIPTSFELDDTVPFDYLALKYFVCWKYGVDDSANPASAETNRALFEARYKHLEKLQGQAGIALNGRGAYDYPREWFVR